MEGIHKRTKRNSSVELFKIIGIILIVVGHQREVFIGTELYLLVSKIYGILPLAHIGNMMFLVPSLWYLCDSDVIKKEKIIWLCVDCIILCVFFLFIYIINDGLNNIDIKTLLYHFPPMSILYYWYIIFYIAIYIFHPIINNFFRNDLSLLKCASIISLLFLLLNSLFEYALNNCFVSAVCYYVIVMYIKHNNKIISYNWSNTIIIAAGFLMVACNYLFNKINSFSDNYIKNLFSFILVLVVFLRYVVNISYSNSLIDLLSHQSLNIFIIHESFLLKNVLRPKFVGILSKNNMSYIHIFIIDCLAVLTISYLCSLLYNYVKKRICYHIKL